eukprot:CAMPEP_0179470916 /NCGR_PEP_ID=MMETSP0799-20121207/51235_1 /TAXON_ID=46947 /ORGANISM="Geminigera cryophila, Strain CCMP2564" /LENGTH=35 /DNA_ID= /DNA_START= /DNA_END= /DNA_ORIENTATION=
MMHVTMRVQILNMEEQLATREGKGRDRKPGDGGQT